MSTTATKLSIFNGALRLLKESPLTQNEVTNNTREPARLLNAVWSDGGVEDCLEAGQWKFAKRAVLLDYSPSVEPDTDFGGYEFVFQKPEDFIRTCGIWTDGSQAQSLTDYREENSYWLANLESIYVTYVSDDAAFGFDYSLWPQSFRKFVHAHFAAEIAGPLTSQGKELLQLRKMMLREALSIDGMADPTKFLPTGNWVKSRGGSARSRENR